MTSTVRKTMTRVPLNITFAVIMCMVWCTVRIVESQSFEEVKHLKDNLLNNETFDETIRPVLNQSESVAVNISLFLLAIHGLDEVQESMKTTGILQIHWHDDNLYWDVEDNPGVLTITVPQDDVWKPDMALKNSLQSYKALGDKSLNVHVSYTGTVTWVPLEVFLSTCAMDITLFPNDVQTCSMTFVAWSYSLQEVILEGPADQGIYLDEYEENSGWDVLDTRWHLGEPITSDTEIVFEIKLKRKSTYSMLTLVFPTIVLTVLNLFVFALPCASGEKSGYAVTIFLAFTVFLTILESSFPHNSEKNSYFAILVFFGTVQSTVITIVTLLMVRFSAYGEDNDIPSFLIAFIRFTRCKALRESCNRTGKSTGKILPAAQTNDGRQSAAITRQGAELDYADDQKERQVYTWKYCIDCLDIVFFCLFTTTCLAAILYFFINIS